MTLLSREPERASLNSYHLNHHKTTFCAADHHQDSAGDFVTHSPTMETPSQVSPQKQMKRSMSMTDDNSNGNLSSDEGAVKKRKELRVENIVTSICQPKSPKSQDLTSSANWTAEQQRNKRKQFVPQQHGSVSENNPNSTGVTNGSGSADIDVVTEDEPCKQSTNTATPSDGQRVPKYESSSEEKMENTLLKNQIRIMGEQLQKNQQINQELSEKLTRDRYELARLALHQPHIDMETYIRAIRTEINQSVKLAVKEALDKHATSTSVLQPPMQSPSTAHTSYNNNNNNNRTHEKNNTNTMAIRDPQLPQQRGTIPASTHNSALQSSISDAQLKRSNSTISSLSSPQIAQQTGLGSTTPHPALANPLLPLAAALPYYGQPLHSPFFTANQLNTAAAQFNNQAMSAHLIQSAMEEEMVQNQIMRERDAQNKKKRTKVTDTRLSPRTSAKPGELQSMNTPVKSEFTLDQAALANKAAFDAFGPSLFQAGMSQMQSVLALNGFCAQQADMLRASNRSPTNLSDNSDQNPSSPELSMTMHPPLPGQNVTLTPLHLRKAKLMFFYVRYPSSVLLKNYFCDVHFNKNNTAQLVKWFSNFREFYYIQMEKYARQSIAEGASSEQVEITTDSELYKILNLHYNRNNQIEVPRSFLDTIQTTLREFIKAITCGKDREQSWKKPIYKIIARLDDTVPEYFKSQEWMEQLSD